jgi:beta-mannosidase
MATVRDAQGNVLASSKQSVKVPALSVLWLEKQPFDFDPYTAHLQYSFEVNGQIVSEGCALFTPPKHYALADPKLSVYREGNDIVLTASAFAKGVFIEGVDGDVILSDNSFDMERGEVRLQILSGNATEFAVMSVFDLM